MKKNPIIALIKEILVELKEEFEEDYDILTEDGPIVFDFCVFSFIACRRFKFCRTFCRCCFYTVYFKCCDDFISGSAFRIDR